MSVFDTGVPPVTDSEGEFRSAKGRSGTPCPIVVVQAAGDSLMEGTSGRDGRGTDTQRRISGRSKACRAGRFPPQWRASAVIGDPCINDVGRSSPLPESSQLQVVKLDTRRNGQEKSVRAREQRAADSPFVVKRRKHA
jgi:hypothetical protein